MNRRTFMIGSSSAIAAMVVDKSLANNKKGLWSNIPDSDEKKISKKTPVLILEGAPRKRGQIHGEALRESIHSHVRMWQESVRKGVGVDPQKHIEDFLGNTSFDKAIETWTPDLMEEVKGISEAANVDFKTLLAMQYIDEGWWYVRNRYFGLIPPSGDKCTVVGVYGQEGLPTILGQNLDLPAMYNGYEILLHIKHHDSELESFVRSCSGIVSLNGMNSAGVGLCLNAVLPLNPRLDGLPVAFVNRGILACKSWKEAVEFIHKIKHASGQTYNIGGKDEIGSFECSGGKVVRYKPVVFENRICHTNHPLVNDDQSLYLELIRKNPGIDRAHDNSGIRLEYADKVLKEIEGKVSMEDIMKVLSSGDNPQHPVCVPLRDDGRGGFTAAATVMKLSGNPELLITNGPPNKYEYQKFNF